MPAQPRYQAPPRQVAPARTASRSDRYLPAMPEMLQKPSQTAQPRPAQLAQADVKQPAAVVRGQAPDEQPRPAKQIPTLPAKLHVPSPEEIGLAPPVAAKSTATKTTDWTSAREQLDQMGATHYRLEKSDGSFRFLCALPHPQQRDKERHFEANGPTEGEAIQAVLEQIAAWRATP